MLSPGMSAARELGRIWSTVTGRLQLVLPAHEWAKWVRPTAAAALEEGVVVVEAASAINCDWLRQHEAAVVGLLREASGEELGVRFVPRGSVARTPGPEAAAPAEPLLGTVNCRFTFERYLRTDGNRVAYEWCRTLLEEPARAISPLVLAGAPGLGKTHLLHALGCEALRAGWAVACLSAEEFTGHYQGALRVSQTHDFQAVIRGVRLLLIDDLQYLTGKKGTQAELIHTMDAVVNRGGFVVLCSERDPHELALPERLESRLDGGLTVRIQPFRLDDRREYAWRLAREHRISLPAWAVERVANMELPSVRAVGGAVNCAIALASCSRLDQATLDAELTRLSMLEASTGRLSERELIERVAARFQVTWEELTGRSRRGGVREARAAGLPRWPTGDGRAGRARANVRGPRSGHGERPSAAGPPAAGRGCGTEDGCECC